MPKDYIVPARKQVRGQGGDSTIRPNDATHPRVLPEEVDLEISREFDKADAHLTKQVVKAYTTTQDAYREACRELGLKTTDRKEEVII